MSQETTTLQMMTQPLLTNLASLDTTVAIVCFGSTALGTADPHSDIDLLTICDPAIPTSAVRRQLFQRLPTLSEIQLHHAAPGWETPWAPQNDTLMLAQTRYDLAYNTKAWITQVVHRVTTDGAISLPEMPFRPYTLLGLLTTSVVLYDPHHVAQTLIRQLQPYPTLLRTHILDAYVPIMEEGVQELRDYATRGIGNTAFLFQLFRVCDAMCSILFAINETYDPATKRVEHALQHLSRLPPQFLARYTQMLEGPFTQAQRQSTVEQLAILVQEIQALL